MDSQEDLFRDDDHGGTTDVATDPVGEGEDSKTGDGTGIGDNGGHSGGSDQTKGIFRIFKLFQF